MKTLKKTIRTWRSALGGLLLVLASPFAAAPAEESPAVERFAVFEASFETKNDYENPYTEVDADAEFQGPENRTGRIPLFWDGDKRWKVRFSPDRVGRWSFRVRSSDPGLDGRSGRFECRPSARRGSLVPMPNHTNHFQYQNGTPVWFMGDTAWGLYTDNDEEKHHREQVEHYIDTRAAQGFNVMHSMLLSEAGWGNRNGPPFHDLTDQKINPAYWREVDERLAYLNGRGVVGGLALAWGDKRKVEPFAWRLFPGVEARKRYARYIAARYSACDVYFLVSGEWHAEVRTRPKTTEEAVRKEFIEIGNALAQSDPHDRMIGIHPMTREGSVREFNEASWMSFADYQQNYQQLHERILLSRPFGRPVVNSEYGYYLRDQDGDGQTDKSNSYSADDMRHASWDIVTAGGYFVTGFGTTYFAGNRDPGPFDVDTAKNDDWEEQIQQIKEFFTGLEWWKLIPADELISSKAPRTGDDLGTVKRGNRRINTIRPPKSTYWAMTIPGEKYVLYVRGLETPVNLESDSREGDFRARQFNPRSGEFTDLGQVHLVGQYEYTPPDKNDWIVLLERAAQVE